MIPEPAQPDQPTVAAGEPTRPLEPVAERERILAIDVLRGVALFGILVVNMQFFALPFGQAALDPTMATAPIGEKIADAFISILFEYKFISLFSLLFGIGLVIQAQRAAARRRPFVGTYLRRLVVLAGIGLVHGLLLWYGDILFIYAIAGVALLPASRMAGGALLRVGVALLLAGAIIGAGCLSLQVAADSYQMPPADLGRGPTVSEPIALDETVEALMVSQWNVMSEPFKQTERRAYAHGDLGSVMLLRTFSFVSSVLYMVIAGYGLHIVAMFYFGAGLMKLRFFDADRRPWQIRMALIGIPIGLLIEASAYAVEVLNEHALGGHMILTGFMHEWGSVILCLGYVGLITLLVNSGALAPIARALGRTGRLALTVYLGETVVATALMYWWGLGWFGSVTRLQMLGLTAAIFGSLLVFAQLWLIPYRIGPAEWAWRCLTYLRVQPLLRREA